MRQPTTTFLLLTLLLAAGCAGIRDAIEGGIDLGSGQLNEATTAAGLREALTVGTERTVARVTVQDGYIGNPDIRIPLPAQWTRPARMLRDVGLGSYVDEIDMTMNRAAERAAREAYPVFADAVAAMTIKDAFAILEGTDTEATDYFRRQTEKQLRARYAPVVTAQMDQLGVTRAYAKARDLYEGLPMNVSVEAVDLEAYVVDGALDGLFTVLAQEERRIRQDPLARTTALLKRVFGGP